MATAILKVGSVPTSLDWYRRAGFEVRAQVPPEAPTWAEVARDGLVLQLLAGETPWPSPPAFTGCFYAHPASVRAVHDEVRHRVHVEWGVEERPWGAVELTLQDPDGYSITFTEPAPGLS